MLVLPEALEALEVRKDWRYFGEVYGEGLCRRVTECISRWMIWMLKGASLGRFSTLETSRNRYAGGRSWFWAQFFYTIAFLILSVFFDAMWHVPWCCEFDSLGVWVLRSFSTDKSSSRNGGVWVMCDSCHKRLVKLTHEIESERKRDMFSVVLCTIIPEGKVREIGHWWTLMIIDVMIDRCANYATMPLFCLSMLIHVAWEMKGASLGRFSTLETSRNRYAGGRSWFWAQFFYTIAFLILSVFFDAMWHVPWCCEFDSLGVWVLRSFSTDKSSSRNGGVWVMCESCHKRLVKLTHEIESERKRDMFSVVLCTIIPEGKVREIGHWWTLMIIDVMIDRCANYATMPLFCLSMLIHAAWEMKGASLGRFSTLETSRNRYAAGRSWFGAESHLIGFLTTYSRNLDWDVLCHSCSLRSRGDARKGRGTSCQLHSQNRQWQVDIIPEPWEVCEPFWGNYNF